MALILRDAAFAAPQDEGIPNTFAPEGASRCRALASGLMGRAAGRKERLFEKVRGLNAGKERKSRKLVENGAFVSFGKSLTAGRTPHPRIHWMWYKGTMKWLHKFVPWHFTRGDVLAALLVPAVLCLLIFVYIRFPSIFVTQTTGFGPDWDCKSVPQGAPICVKKIAR